MPVGGDEGHPGVQTDLTGTRFRGFVRKEEYWPEDSEQYKAGCEPENRKRPPPDEVPGDAFDRQRVIPGFDQGLVERQVCLVLGTGGIGQDVALTLARLGVGKIILVDRDVYDANNLTRQCLGWKTDVGKRKVDVAARTLRECHNLRSEIETVHCDAVLEWPRIVALARQATVVFNAIDVGVMWDFCVNSLCKELGLPLACGQSFGWTLSAEMYSGKPSQVCAVCYESSFSSFVTAEKEEAAERLVSQTGGLLQRLQSFLAQRPNGARSLDAECLAEFLAEDRQFRCSGGSLCGEVVRCALGQLGREELSSATLATDLARFLKSLHDEATSRLLPGRISGLPDVAFIPRPRTINTRFVGSWVCPCLGTAVIMVSQWTAWLTAPPPEEGTASERQRNPAQEVLFNLDTGLTNVEQEVAVIGMAPDDRRFVCTTSREGCRVCAAAANLRAEESLFVGRLPIVLSPVEGEVIDCPTSWRDPPPPGDTSGKRAEGAATALARRSPLAHLGEAYAQAVVPALPALDWERGEGCVGGGGATAAAWPPELAVLPMLKVPPSAEAALHPSALHGVASGVRSALVKARGCWWRLKGCGNRDEGFPVEAKGDQGELNVRGCCFQHTADCELRMTELAAAALSAAGLDCANKSVGSYRYAPASDWPLPKIERYCCIFKTLGNARLGDHLIAGLLRLLPRILPPPPDSFAGLQAAVAAGRGVDPAEELWPTATVAECGMPVADVVAELKRAQVRLSECTPPSAEQMGDELPVELAATWNSACGRLADHLKSLSATTEEPSLLLWLSWRLGWECGAAVKALHAAGIAWGTYPDAMGIHCNAHVNNFVVKPLGSGDVPSTFLAALDFDMAFTKDGYLPEAAASKAGLGLDTWEGVLNFEATMGMRLVLGGSDFASTGVANDGASVPESHKAVEAAVRDTLVAAYEAARTGGEDAHPHKDVLHNAAYDLIRLALCLTTHVEG